MAVDQGPFGRPAFLLSQSGDARFKIVDMMLEIVGLLEIPGGAVGSHQFVEVAQQGASFSGVTAHGSVAPTVGVSLEPARQPHQLAHVVHHLLGVAQLGEPLAGHASSHRLVVVEGDRSPLIGAGAGLAHVVEQRGQPEGEVSSGLGHHRDGVGQHVFVAVDRILLQAERGQFGNDLVGEAGVN